MALSITMSGENIVDENGTKSQMLVALKPMKWNLKKDLAFFMKYLACFFLKSLKKIVIVYFVYLSCSFSGVSHE